MKILMLWPQKCPNTNCCGCKYGTSWLLVGVGHHATDEVGLGLVEGGHQVVELALEVGGDSLAALTLLPVLVLGSLQRLPRMVLEA